MYSMSGEPGVSYGGNFQWKDAENYLRENLNVNWRKTKQSNPLRASIEALWERLAPNSPTKPLQNDFGASLNRNFDDN